MSNGLLEAIQPIILLFKVNDFLVLKFMVFHKHSPVYSSIQRFRSYIPGDLSAGTRSPRGLKVTSIINQDAHECWQLCYS